MYPSAKYGLSITSHVIETHPDGKLFEAFDIGCTFKKTIDSSKLLGPIAESQELYVLVNAFHGWAHNRACQLQHHPLFTQGAGIEDLEGMERLFAASNQVASLVRSASRFHWLQFYDLHFQQWDEDKYANLCMFTPKSTLSATDLNLQRYFC